LAGVLLTGAFFAAGLAADFAGAFAAAVFFAAGFVAVVFFAAVVTEGVVAFLADVFWGGVAGAGAVF